MPGPVRYTNPRLTLLTAGEVGMYDLALTTSRVLEQGADGGIEELLELIEGTDMTKARAGLHRMLAWAFTLGCSFAVSQLSSSKKKPES